MITTKQIYKTALDLLKKSVVEIPDDVSCAYQQAAEKEAGLAREIYDFFFSFRQKDALLCEDTSHIIFYITIGTKCVLDPEIDWWRTLSRATEAATWGTEASLDSASEP